MPTAEPTALTGTVAFATADDFGSIDDALYALRADGTVWRTQSPTFPDSIYVASPAPPTKLSLTGIKAISAFYRNVYALGSDGRVWAWGADDHGQLGDGKTAYRTTPAIVPGLSNVVTVAAGWNSGLFVERDGTVWAIGDDGQGRLGDGSTADKTSPVRIDGLSNVVALIATESGSWAVESDATVWSWGFDASTPVTPIHDQQACPAIGLSAYLGGTYIVCADGTVSLNGYLTEPGLTGVATVVVGSYGLVIARKDATACYYYNGVCTDIPGARHVRAIGFFVDRMSGYDGPRAYFSV